MTTIPGGASAGVSGFSGCSKLTALDIPSNITSMAGYSMPNCSALQSISIPKECISIGSGAFANDSALTSVYYDGNVENWMRISFGNEYANPLTYAHNLYINNELLTSLNIPNTLTTIKAYTFNGATCLSGNVVIPKSVTSIGNSAFKNCTGITSITIPNSVTSLGASCFYGCTGIESDFIALGVTTVSSEALRNCSKLKNVDLRNAYVNNGRILSAGDGYHTLMVKGFTNEASNISELCFETVLCYGSVTDTTTASRYYIMVRNYVHVVRLAGSYSISNSGFYINSNGNANHGVVKFLELMGTYTGSNFARTNIYNRQSGDVVHLGYSNGIALQPAVMAANNSYITTICVGDGSSRANDEAILALYLADSEWSAYSSKLATWYDYNGVYKWYYVTDNLTNCTNTNPDEWPHITRGDSYETTIVPDEDMTLDSVTVEMYEAVDNGTTPDTPTDITNDVYNASTGEINIPSVTGNIIITAMAS